MAEAVGNHSSARLLSSNLSTTGLPGPHSAAMSQNKKGKERKWYYNKVVVK
jgi:hypothetical protein